MNAKRTVLVLFCSALGLLTAIAYVKRPAASAPREIVAPTAEGNVSAPARTAPESKPRVVPRIPADLGSVFTWRQVESADYKQYVANLRQIGCPEQTIRDIIVADVNKLYAEREAPLKAKPAVANKNAPAEAALPADELERRKQLRELQAEKRGVLKELLGIDVPLDLLPSNGSRNYGAYELALKSLPAEKRDFVQQLQEGYWQESDALKAKYNNKRTPEFVQESRLLSDSLRQELGKILTPTELENYEIRTSTSANRLGQQLAIFTPTEEEFRQIFRATRDYDERVANLSGQGIDKKAVQEERAAATAQRDEQLRTVLGEQRFADYQRAQDSNYRNLVRVGERYNLPQETIMQAYDLEKSFASQPVAFTDAGNPQLVDGAKREGLKQLNEQLTAVLGDKAAKAYRRVRGGLIVTDPEP